MTASESAARMKDWFKENTIPESVNPGHHESIKDTEQYIQTAINTMEFADVNSNNWRSAYFRLYALKQHIEKLTK